MDIYNLNLSSSDGETTASDCDSDNGISNVIVEDIYNVKSQKQPETLLRFKTQDDLKGSIENMVIQVVKFSRGDKKFERFLPTNQHTQRKLLHFLREFCTPRLKTRQPVLQ